MQGLSRYFFSLLLGLLLIASQGSAYNGGYSGGYEPFPRAIKPRLVAAREERAVSFQEYLWSFPLKGCKRALIRVLAGDQPVLQLTWPAGSATWSLDGIQPYPCEGWRLDLNGDGKPDLVLNFSGTGCGLASEYTNTLFFLSAGSDYVVRGLHSMGFGAEDLVDLDGNGRPEILATEFFSGDPDAQGRTHTYWVYSAYRASGGELQRVRTMDPVWIQYTFRKNHRPTKHFSDRQKQRLWEEQHKEPVFELQKGLTPTGPKDTARH